MACFYIQTCLCVYIWNGRASRVSQYLRISLTMKEAQEMQVQSLGREDTLEKEMATHSSLLAWKIPWTKSLVGGTPWSHKESDRTERLITQIHMRQEQHTIHVSSFIHCYNWKGLWCWEGLGARGEGDDRGWDGWMASLTRWTWVSVNSGSRWWTGRPGVLQFMGSQRVGQDWATYLIWSLNDRINSWFHFPFFFLLMGKLRTRCHKWTGLERKSGDNVKSGLSLYSEHPYVNTPVSHSRLYKCMD